MADTAKEQRAALRELFTSEGWGLIKATLMEQEYVMMERLLTQTDPKDIYATQGFIESLRALIDLESTMLEREEAAARDFLLGLLTPKPFSLGLEEGENGRRRERRTDAARG